MPSCWTTRFEAWVVPKSNHPSTCLDWDAKPLDHSIWGLGSPQAKSPLNVFGFKCQAVEPPNLRLVQNWSLKLNPPPQHVWIQMPNCWTTQFETWTNLKSQIILLNVFGSRISNRWTAQFEIGTNFKSQILPTCLDSGFPNRRISPNWDLDKSRIFKQLNCPIRDWNKFQIPNSPDLFGLRISKPSNLSKLRFGQVSNPNFLQTQLSLCKSQI